MINHYFLKERFDRIVVYLEQIEIILGNDDSRIRGDFTLLYAIERLIQLVVDEMIDVNTHIIRNEEFRAPDDFQSAFYTLGENGVIDEDLAKRLAPIVGLRNRLVHRYESVDMIFMLAMIRKERADITEYMKQIRARYKDVV